MDMPIKYVYFQASPVLTEPDFSGQHLCSPNLFGVCESAY